MPKRPSAGTLASRIAERMRRSVGSRTCCSRLHDRQRDMPVLVAQVPPLLWADRDPGGAPAINCSLCGSRAFWGPQFGRVQGGAWIPVPKRPGAISRFFPSNLSFAQWRAATRPFICSRGPQRLPGDGDWGVRRFLPHRALLPFRDKSRIQPVRA